MAPYMETPETSGAKRVGGSDQNLRLPKLLYFERPAWHHMMMRFLAHRISFTLQKKGDGPQDLCNGEVVCEHLLDADQESSSTPWRVCLVICMF